VNKTYERKGLAEAYDFEFRLGLISFTSCMYQNDNERPCYSKDVRPHPVGLVAAALMI